ncbi:MAG: alkaline phosphatase family protein, partial [Longimicrobiales bacterium]
MSRPASPATVLAIGIDAASPALLERWMDNGTLPNLAALRDRGVTGETRGIDGFFAGSTWPSLYTATNPARHGIHYGVQLRAGSYDYYRPADEDFVHGQPFWSRLSHAGRRVAILDVPLSRLDRSIHGMHVVEWGGHDAVFGFSAWPAAIEAAIRTEFGPHPAAVPCDAERRTPEDYDRFVETLIRGARAKGALTRRFLADGGWDFFMQVFTEAHCAGHQCWHLHDATHPTHDPRTRARIGDPLRSVYVAIDREIGEIAAAAGDPTIIVFTAHGMAHWYGAGFLLRDILFRLDVARARVSEPHGSPGLARHAWRTVPRRLRDRLAPLRDLLFGARATVAPRGPVAGIDTSTSRCFA